MLFILNLITHTSNEQNIYQVGSFIKQMRSLIKKRIKTTPNDINSSFQTQNYEQEQLKMPFKPFQVKFNSMKQSQIIPDRKQSAVSTNQKQYQLDERRIQTQAQTDDIYQSDFQEYDQSFEDYQTVQQQNQLAIQTVNPQNQSQHQQQDDQFQWYSPKQINSINIRLIENIQFFRYALRKYRYNANIIRKQQKQLEKLKYLRDKAIDYNYELQLERQTANKTDLSKSQIKNIRQASVLINKAKYKMTKQSHRKANPKNFEQQYSIIENKQRNLQLKMVRQQLLCKKRQFYHHQEQIKQLQDKIKCYEQSINKFQSKLSVVNIDRLSQRKKQLQAEITMKKINLEENQIEINLQINSLNNQLAALEMESLKITQENNLLKQKQRQSQIANNSTPKSKQSLSILFRKKSVPQADQPKSSLRIPNKPQNPRAIARFFYNPNKNRNSSILNINPI